MISSIHQICHVARNPYFKQLEDLEHTYEFNEISIINALHQGTTKNSPHIIIMDKLKLACKSNISYEKLVKEGFPESKLNTDAAISAYWELSHCLSYGGELIWLDSRLVIPQDFHSQVLNVLDSGHQGVSSMTKRANQTV